MINFDALAQLFGSPDPRSSDNAWTYGVTDWIGSADWTNIFYNLNPENAIPNALTPWISGMGRGSQGQGQLPADPIVDQAVQNWVNFSAADQQSIRQSFSPEKRALLDAKLKAAGVSDKSADATTPGLTTAATTGTGDPFDTFARAVLKGINAPETQNNINILYNWAVHEHGAGMSPVDYNNPLNTTEPWAGATDFNSVGVKQYQTLQNGIDATIATLVNGNYNNIIAGLQNNVDPNTLADMATNDFGTWGSGTGWLRGQLTDYAGTGGAYGGTTTAGTGLPPAPGEIGSAYQVEGHTLIRDSPDDILYRMIDAAWEKAYGQHAPFSMIAIMRTSGITTQAQVDDLLNSLPSDIPGWSIGQRTSLKAAADKIANQYLGRPIPDSLLKEFGQQGIDSPGLIDGWFATHGLKDIPKEQYQSIFDAALPYTHGVYGTVPHPTQVQYFHKASSGGGAPNPNAENPLRQRQQDRG